MNCRTPLIVALLCSPFAVGCMQLGGSSGPPHAFSSLSPAARRAALDEADPVRIEQASAGLAANAAPSQTQSSSQTQRNSQTPSKWRSLADGAEADSTTVQPAAYETRQYRAQNGPGYGADNGATPGTAGDHYRYGMPASGGSPRVAQNGVNGAPPQFAPAQPGFAPGNQGAPAFGPSGPIMQPNPYDLVDPVRDAAPAIPFDVFVEEERTGRFIFGVGVNSDAGLTGQVVVDEQNFDWRAIPRNWQDVWDGYAFRGGGQRFRLEAMPGDQVQRYLVSLTEPYLFDTQVSMSSSASYYDRAYFDWNEQRVGGRMSLGYRLSPDLSVSTAFRGERVKIFQPRVGGVDELDAVIGDNNIYGFQTQIAHDTRDVPFAPTEGHLIELSFEQVIGDFDYPRAELDFRQHFLVFERPDGSGRHTLSYLFRVGVTGSQTPIFENYYAGGFSTLRGFDFRGASPVDGSVIVGGEFRFLGSVEYMMPLTADDMLKGVVFCDFGTVEERPAIHGEDYRVAVGAGLRISIPALGPAPLALDFAFPLASEDTDTQQMFSFFFGMGRG